jgi:hypothetical protein
LEIWPDLFGGFSLAREYGRIGQPGRLRLHPFPEEIAAAAKPLPGSSAASGGAATWPCRLPGHEPEPHHQAARVQRKDHSHGRAGNQPGGSRAPQGRNDGTGRIFIDLYPATDDNPATMNIAFSGPALEKIEADPAQHGMDVGSYMEKIWQETLARERASEKGKKQL